MLSRRWLTGVLVGLLTANTLPAQGINLTEATLKDRCLRNELTMEFAGKITVAQDGKEITYPHQATARHVYLERYLDDNGNVADRAARIYETAERTSRFNNDKASTITLRKARSFMGVQRVKDLTIAYSPDGRLTRDEVDLTEHLDTLAVPGIVPGKEIAVGKSWRLSNSVIAALCGLDGLTGHTVEGTLDAVKGTTVHARLVGTVNGIDKGAEVAVLVNGRLEFDVAAQCITNVEWKQTETRQQTPISPKIDAEVVIRLKRAPIDQPDDLSNNAIVGIGNDKTPPAHRTNIDHADAKQRFQLQYPRDWHVTSPDDNAQLVMRHMDKGAFIAQVTVSPWNKVNLKAVMNLGQFADAMAGAPTWKQDKEISREELKETPKNHHLAYRVVATGELDGVKTWQYFYLIVGQAGDQCIVTFSVVPEHVQRLGARDLELVRELVLPEAGK